MDWTAIIQEIGGGLSAVVIAGLAFVAWRKDRQVAEKDAKIIEIHSRAIEREREHASELIATMGPVGDAVRLIEGLRK